MNQTLKNILRQNGGANYTRKLYNVTFDATKKIKVENIDQGNLASISEPKSFNDFYTAYTAYTAGTTGTTGTNMVVAVGIDGSNPPQIVVPPLSAEVDATTYATNDNNNIGVYVANAISQPITISEAFSKQNAAISNANSNNNSSNSNNNSSNSNNNSSNGNTNNNNNSSGVGNTNNNNNGITNNNNSSNSSSNSSNNINSGIGDASQISETIDKDIVIPEATCNINNEKRTDAEWKSYIEQLKKYYKNNVSDYYASAKKYSDIILQLLIIIKNKTETQAVTGNITFNTSATSSIDAENNILQLSVIHAVNALLIAEYSKQAMNGIDDKPCNTINAEKNNVERVRGNYKAASNKLKDDIQKYEKENNAKIYSIAHNELYDNKQFWNSIIAYAKFKNVQTLITSVNEVITSINNDDYMSNVTTVYYNLTKQPVTSQPGGKRTSKRKHRRNRKTNRRRGRR